jgi:hypothetical protein
MIKNVLTPQQIEGKLFFFLPYYQAQAMSIHANKTADVFGSKNFNENISRGQMMYYIEDSFV